MHLTRFFYKGVRNRYLPPFARKGFTFRYLTDIGTSIDSLRLRVLLAKHLSVSARTIHAYVIGEHGDNQVLVAIFFCSSDKYYIDSAI
jgi:hypothetical protein